MFVILAIAQITTHLLEISVNMHRRGIFANNFQVNIFRGKLLNNGYGIMHY